MHDLSRLLRPKSIAVIGGGAWCEQIILQCQQMGFAGELWMVHPKTPIVRGVQAVADLDQLPHAPDAVFVGVNRHLTVDLVGQLSAMGAGGAVCFASGFSEALAEDETAGDLQAQLVAAAGDMPFLGPNCYGYINALDQALLWPDQHGCAPIQRGVAILTQSSNIAINLSMQTRALPISYMIACGNMAQTSQAQIAMALLDDPRVSAIGLHIEGFSDTHEWHQLAQKAHEKGIPLVALKVGKSEQAQRATVSHTASLAGSDAGANALLQRFGIARVDDLPCLLETLMLLHSVGKLEHKTLSSISCSGGEASLIADLAHDTDLDFPPLTAAQIPDLKEALGPLVALSNPLDYNTYIWRDVDAMHKAWLPMAAPHIGLTLLIVDYPHTDATDWICATQAAIRIHQSSKRPVAVVATLPELMPQDVAQQLLDAGVTPLRGLREAIKAAQIAASARTPVSAPPLPAGEDRETLQLSEAQGKTLLAQADLQIPQVAQDLETARTLTGPFAVKGTGFAHKSEAGAVALNVTHENLQQVVQEMPGSGVLIEQMITGSVAEILLGVLRDPAHGFVLTIGAGGVLTELMQDTVSLILPVDENQIRMALQSLKCYPLLTGFRAQVGADIPALVNAILRLQDFVVAQADHIEEVEINPIICTQSAAIVADALIRISPERTAHEPD